MFAWHDISCPYKTKSGSALTGFDGIVVSLYRAGGKKYDARRIRKVHAAGYNAALSETGRCGIQGLWRNK
jgi:hypothetical protein